MTQIIKGENLPVPGQGWRIEVDRQAAGGGVPEVAASALLLDATGKAVRHLVLERAGVVDGRLVDRLDVDTERVGVDVRRIVIVAVGQNGMLGQVPGLSVRTLSTATGEQLALYEVDDATTETALVLGEYYPRDDGWKFRAVGEGYDAGFSALAEDFGISVPAPAPAPAPAPVPVPVPGGPVPVEIPRGAVGKSAAPGGPVPAELPLGAVGKSPGPAADTKRGQGSGSGSGSGSRSGSTECQGERGGSGSTKGEVGVHGPGSPPAQSRAQTGGQSPPQPPSESSPQAPSRRPGAIPVVPSPTPSPEAVAAVAPLGGEFDDIVYSGRGSAKFAMDTTPPPGYVLVDFARTGKGFFDLDSIDWDGRQARDLGNTATSHRFERRVMWCDNLYPLRFRVGCDDHDEWTIVIRPVSAVRVLGEAATGRGPEVLLHTGPAGELVSRLRPTEATGSLSVQGYKPRRPNTPATYPTSLASDSGRSPKGARVLPEGPLLVAVVEGAGDWSLEVCPPREVPSQEKRSGFWRRFGRS
ncbi:TerD family protein [Streptomyces sp. SJL17-1]|uniref:TerD family protein n=1 Tax=Streptomyces sp. SJL17-1 TaxID=2967223 RepID=UPI002966BEE8|nr:TerD family protein [Streptomyces sp. SJL17-1]